MPFKLVSRPDPAPMEFLVTNATALSFGQCVTFSAGRLVAAGTTTPVAGVTTHAVTAGTDRRCKVILVDPEQTWEADYTGTPVGGFVVGVNSAVLDAAGNNLNSTNVTSGPCAIVAIDAPPRKALVKFRLRHLT